MPGHLQEGFGCVVTNRFDHLFDDEEDPFEVLKQAETKKKDTAAPGAAKTAAQAAKQQKKETQKDRKVPLPEKKEESTTPVPLKKEGENVCSNAFFPLSSSLSLHFIPRGCTLQTQHAHTP